jgi:predicted transcriptional regulator
VGAPGFYQEFSRARGLNVTDLKDLRKRILKLLKGGPMKGAEIETALIGISNHTAIRRAIRYASEDGLITRDKVANPWRLVK